MQQSLFSNGQTGEHFARIPRTLNLRSSSICCRPFASPDLVIIFWIFPQHSTVGLFMGIIVSFHGFFFPPLLLFISNAEVHLA